MALEHLKRYAEGGEAGGSSSPSMGALPVGSGKGSLEHPSTTDDFIQALVHDKGAKESYNSGSDRELQLLRANMQRIIGDPINPFKQPSGFFNSGIAPWQIATAAPSQVNAYSQAYSSQNALRGNVYDAQLKQSVAAQNALYAQSMNNLRNNAVIGLASKIDSNVGQINNLVKANEGLDPKSTEYQSNQTRINELEDENSRLSTKYQKARKDAAPDVTHVNNELIKKTPTGPQFVGNVPAPLNQQVENVRLQDQTKKSVAQPTPGLYATVPSGGATPASNVSVSPAPAAYNTASAINADHPANSQAGKTAGITPPLPPPPRTGGAPTGPAAATTNIFADKQPSTGVDGLSDAETRALEKEMAAANKKEWDSIIKGDGQKVSGAITDVRSAKLLKGSTIESLDILQKPEGERAQRVISEPGFKKALVDLIQDGIGIGGAVGEDGGFSLRINADAQQLAKNLQLGPDDAAAMALLLKNYTLQGIKVLKDSGDTRPAVALYKMFAQTVPGITDPFAASMVRLNETRLDSEYAEKRNQALIDYAKDPRNTYKPISAFEADSEWGMNGKQAQDYARRKRAVVEAGVGAGVNKLKGIEIQKRINDAIRASDIKAELEKRKVQGGKS